MKRIALLVLIAVLLLLFAAAVGAYKMNRFMDSTVSLKRNIGKNGWFVCKKNLRRDVCLSETQ